MAVVPVATDRWRALFHRAAVANARYWLQMLQASAPQAALTPVVYANVFKALSAAVELNEGWRWGSELIKVFHDFAKRQGYWTEWLACLAHWWQRSRERDEPATQARALMYTGEILSQRGAWAAAESYFQTALELLQDPGDDLGRGRVLVNLGQVCGWRQAFDLAESYCQQALAFFKVRGDTRGVAMARNSLGLLYRDQGQPERALEQFELAYRSYLQMEAPYALAHVCLNMGTIYRRQGSFQEAIEYLTRADELYRETGDTVQGAMATMGLGNVYLNLSQVEQAENCYLRVERVLRQGQSRMEQAQIYHNLGLVYMEKKDWFQAQVCLERATDTWRKLGQTRGLVNSLDSLGELLVKRGKKDKARGVLLEAVRILDESPQTPAMEELRRLVNMRLKELDQGAGLSGNTLAE